MASWVVVHLQDHFTQLTTFPVVFPCINTMPLWKPRSAPRSALLRFANQNWRCISSLGGDAGEPSAFPFFKPRLFRAPFSLELLAWFQRKEKAREWIWCLYDHRDPLLMMKRWFLFANCNFMDPPCFRELLYLKFLICQQGPWSMRWCFSCKNWWVCLCRPAWGTIAGSRRIYVLNLHYLNLL